MGRGTLPSYTRISHVPNLLEAYRYLTRKNLTVISSELCMSYHTVRRLCTDYSTPQAKTMDKITKALSFIDKITWGLWKEYCESALYAEKQNDIATLVEVESKLRRLVPVEGIVAPVHIITDCTIESAIKLHASALNNKTYSFYLSDLHSGAMDLLAIRNGTTKSELLRQMIDKALSEQPEALEALIRITLGAPVEVIPLREPTGQVDELDIIEVQSEAELAALAPELEYPELVAQLTAELPSKIDDGQEEPSRETTLPLAEVIDYSSEDHKLDIEEWSPLVSAMGSNSILSEEEIAALFSGEI
jgi:hypothetical protein